MDVQPGRCWRCERVLPQHSVPCEFCRIAKYCSTPCRNKDKVRHGSVECHLYGDNKCDTCGRTAPNIFSECASCNDAWYCNKGCQRRHWPAHKELCKKVKEIVTKLSADLTKRNSKLACNTRVADSSHYFGNTMAKDFLKLANNELSGETTAEQLTRDFHVLSAGCGDLRSTVLTAASLPDEYQGKLHITLNDFDPFVMARNVLFLFMLVRFADTDYIASSLTTIWYSLHISKREYDLIKTSLDELIQMSAQQLSHSTRGLVTVQDEDLRDLCQVWERWQSLECQRDKKTSINLRKQREKVFEPYLVKGVSAYLARLSPEDQKANKEWFDHALFVPTQTVKIETLPFDNPTLTGRGAHFENVCYVTAPVDCEFVYCIKESSFPFAVWDCLRVRENTPGSHSSPMVMYHKYVTNLLQKVKSLILQGRLLIHVSLANCLAFPKNHHQTLSMPNYDRIFTSNLADYVGFAKLLQTFKPLLDASNSYSAIVTESMNWIETVPGANITSPDSSMFERSKDLCIQDTGTYTDGLNPVREYYDNTICFLMYLRADFMAGGLGIPPREEVPSFESVKKYHGLRMRDFRKGLNKLVPFQYRVNARDLTMLNGYDRAVEWYLPQSDA
ncbi:uncharacterized protein LOC119721775 [Patiria miniata]|uniref:MYND-type domain-containing protein n=1 Tax=Patiria miniata TaxID=46514 RepID=A0A913Z9H4_PATMI|nr:uncharacterized protein LOC119721775 [Patiria miniata]